MSIPNELYFYASHLKSESGEDILEIEREEVARIILPHYLESLAWSSTDENGDTIDHLEFTQQAQTRAFKEIQQFLEATESEKLEWWENWDCGHFGHDFALTRNGHGAGFWDRGHGEIGEQLSELARIEGEVYCHVNENLEIETE